MKIIKVSLHFNIQSLLSKFLMEIVTSEKFNLTFYYFRIYEICTKCTRELNIGVFALQGPFDATYAIYSTLMKAELGTVGYDFLCVLACLNVVFRVPYSPKGSDVFKLNISYKFIFK